MNRPEETSNARNEISALKHLGTHFILLSLILFFYIAAMFGPRSKVVFEYASYAAPIVAATLAAMYFLFTQRQLDKLGDSEIIIYTFCIFFLYIGMMFHLSLLFDANQIASLNGNKYFVYPEGAPIFFSLYTICCLASILLSLNKRCESINNAAAVSGIFIAMLSALVAIINTVLH